MKLNIIKYKGTKDYFVCLGEIKDNYYAFIAKVGKISFETSQDKINFVFNNDIIYDFIENIQANVKIDFTINNNILYHIIALNDKKDYDIVVNTLECVL
jgi:hypothetical protein